MACGTKDQLSVSHRLCNYSLDSSLNLPGYSGAAMFQQQDETARFSKGLFGGGGVGRYVRPHRPRSE
jgi:hypothetical protein